MTTISDIQTIICGKRVEHWSPSTEDALLKPLRWKKPRRIFVNSMSDLFHPGVPDEWIDKVFAVMALTPHHTYQVLTKRPDRMRAYFANPNTWGRIFGLAETLKPSELYNGNVYSAKYAVTGKGFLPNVWLGVSVEDQSAADARIPDLLATPAAVRFLSMEPLLRPVDLRPYLWASASLSGSEYPMMNGPRRGEAIAPADRLHWVIVGGESGPNARPMHPDWVRSIRDQCAEAGVPWFFKQWGEWEPRHNWNHHIMRAIMPDGSICPDDAVPQDVGAHRMARVGKKAAGNHLDGVQHLAFPAGGGM
jgi:protein gp37